MKFKISAEPVEQLTLAMSDGLDPVMLTAAAILKDNHIEAELASLAHWANVAMNINKLMAQNDEARFTLYDYLDALINCAADNAKVEQRLAHMRDSELAQELLFEDLVSLAVKKRKTYNGEF